jgi:hypothetical protein
MRHCATPAGRGASRAWAGAGMSSGSARVSRSRREVAKTARCSAWRRVVGVLVGVSLSLIGEGTVGWAVAAEDQGPSQPLPQWRVIATVNYSSGFYGTDARTNILYAPMTIRRMFQDGDISLTIPFVSISGTGAVRLVGGVPTRTSSATAGSVGGSPVRPEAARGLEPVLCPTPRPTADSAILSCVAAIISLRKAISLRSWR